MNVEIAKAVLNWEANEEADKYEEVTPESILDQGRWNTTYSQVYQHVGDGTFWEITWSQGSTEYQDEGPENIQVREVKQVQKMVTVYE